MVRAATVQLGEVAAAEPLAYQQGAEGPIPPDKGVAGETDMPWAIGFQTWAQVVAEERAKRGNPGRQTARAEAVRA